MNTGSQKSVTLTIFGNVMTKLMSLIVPLRVTIYQLITICMVHDWLVGWLVTPCDGGSTEGLVCREEIEIPMLTIDQRHSD